MKTWILTSLIAGLVPCTVMFVLYTRLRWEDSDTGIVMFWLIAIANLNYLVNILAVITSPASHYTYDLVDIVRVVLRFMIAVVLWGMLRIFLRRYRHPME